MKIAYFDTFSGISGDMILGSLFDAGLNKSDFLREIKKFKLTGYKIASKKVKRNYISGTKFDIHINKQPHRNLKNIIDLINKSKLDKDIKEKSIKAFTDIGKVEASIHRKKLNDVHFHEIGAVDSIIDIVGAFIAIKLMGIEKVYSSKIHCGTGFIKCHHGKLPVPAPATLALLKNVPIYSTGVKEELVTPTGACLIKHLSSGFGPIPEMKVKKIGYGAGSKILDIPNLLRVFIGEVTKAYNTKESILIETNIDDMTPENVGYVQEILFKRGAKDVFVTPIYMKKNRPAIMLSVLTEPDLLDEILTILFKETTTLGLRIKPFQKVMLERKIVNIKTKYGNAQVKIGKINDKILTISPEYESARKIALKTNTPFKDVYSHIKNKTYN